MNSSGHEAILCNPDENVVGLMFSSARWTKLPYFVGPWDEVSKFSLPVGRNLPGICHLPTLSHSLSPYPISLSAAGGAAGERAGERCVRAGGRRRAGARCSGGRRRTAHGRPGGQRHRRVGVHAASVFFWAILCRAGHQPNPSCDMQSYRHSGDKPEYVHLNIPKYSYFYHLNFIL